MTNGGDEIAAKTANDPHCDSTVFALPSCQMMTITQWHADLAKHVCSIDPNHLIPLDMPVLFSTSD
jgi:hypothetical protein